MRQKFLVTGGAGFIGSAVVRHLIQNTQAEVLCFDKLTYAGNLDSLSLAKDSSRYRFVRGDICDGELVKKVINEFEPDVVMHLAAESHVDKSIGGPGEFIQSNIVGTFVLLEACRELHQQGHKIRFHHISTDEVYGDLGGSDGLFTEDHTYAPSSPYSASKASSDHLVRAWQRTYGLDTVITNCSNNYGPYHFPEKLIPLVILRAIEGKPLPIYGNGQQIRDWLYVDDHARALVLVATNSRAGETYNIGGHNEQTNLDVVKQICGLLDELVELKPGAIDSFAELITFVEDRPGHDLRYAVDASKIKLDLGWTPQETFATGLRKTVMWYLQNETWWRRIESGEYRV